MFLLDKLCDLLDLAHQFRSVLDDLIIDILNFALHLLKLVINLLDFVENHVDLIEHVLQLLYLLHLDDLAVEWSSHEDKLWEVLIVLKFGLSHNTLSLDDHVNLHFVALCLSLCHAVAIAVPHNCNNEIHNDDVPYNDYNEPNNP
jgi:hypothetical protein